MALFAARYARALADAADQEAEQEKDRQESDPAEIERQLADFRATLAEAKDLSEVLLNPTISAKKRVAVLDAVNRRAGMGPKTRNFLAVLIEHERLNALDEILEQYRLEIDRRQGISEAEVITARPLEDRERADLERRVAGLAGTRVRAIFREDQSLIGGVIFCIGSTVYDGSVQGRLDRLRDRLVTG